MSQGFLEFSPSPGHIPVRPGTGTEWTAELTTLKDLKVLRHKQVREELSQPLATNFQPPL